jgi:hypothetical protein
VASWQFETRTVASLAQQIEQRAKTPRAREREWTRLAMDNVRRDPAAMLRATLWKTIAYWRLWLHPAEHGPKSVALSAFVFTGLYAAGAIGLARHPDKRLVLAAVAFLVVMWLAHLPYVPSIRLRMPLVDPLMIVFASGAVIRDSRLLGPRTARAGAGTQSRSASP